MDNLDDIKYAVIEDESGEIVAFFGDQDLAEMFADTRDEGELRVLHRDDGDFYIDINVETSSSFDIRG